MVELYLELTDGLAAFLHGTANFREEADGRGLRLRKYVYVVRGHALLGDENLLRAVDDEVSS